MTKPQLTEEEVNAAENIFQESLRERGLKFTRERHTLLHEVLSNAEHFEADQILVNLRQSGKRVAKATIYRTLPLLAACGILRQVQFGDKLTRYEHTLGQSPHDHMVCRRCRKVIEFETHNDSDAGTGSHGVSDPSGHARDGIERANRGRSRHGFLHWRLPEHLPGAAQSAARRQRRWLLPGELARRQAVVAL